MSKTLGFSLIVSFMALSACGDSIGEQSLIGGGVGAGTALVLDADPLTGALIGAGANVLYCQTGDRTC